MSSSNTEPESTGQKVRSGDVVKESKVEKNSKDKGFFAGQWVRRWLPSRGASIGLLAWALLAAGFIYVVTKFQEDQAGARKGCPVEPGKTEGLSRDITGSPPADATLNAKLGPERGFAETSTSWQAGPGAADQVSTVKARSSALRRAEDGKIIPADQVTAVLEVNGGLTLLRVCIDPKFGLFEHGSFAGFVAIPTSEPGNPLTVRTQLAVQSVYVAYFWPLIPILVVLALALSSEKLDKSKPVRWLAMFTGIGACAGIYATSALSNPSWGGLKDAGSLVLAMFTAATGAVAAPAAIAGTPTSDRPPPTDTAADGH